MDYYLNDFPNRTICSVLEDGRNLVKKVKETGLLTPQLITLEMIIEEAQFHANRMEVHLENKKDYYEWMKKRSSLKREIRELREKKEALEKALPKGGNENDEEESNN